MPRRQKRDENASRLETVPRWLWEVLEAAKLGKMYLRTFPAKNFAVNAMHRYHEFRRDAIREGFPGADILTEMPCSWDKTDKEKCTLIWVFIGNLADYIEPNSTPTVEVNRTTPLQEGTIRPLGDQSESERLVEKMYGIGWNKEPAIVESPPESETLDVPAPSKGELTPPCPPHEPSDITDGCIKCGLAQHLW